MTQQIGSTCQISNMQQFLARHRCHCLYHRCAPPLQRRSGSTGLSLSSVAADACHSVHQFEPTANVLISALIVCWICASLLHHWGAEAVLEQKYWCTVTLNEKIAYASHLKPPKSNYSRIKGCSPCSVTCVTNKPQARAFWLCHIVPWTPPASGRR